MCPNGDMFAVSYLPQKKFVPLLVSWFKVKFQESRKIEIFLSKISTRVTAGLKEKGSLFPKRCYLVTEFALLGS